MSATITDYFNKASNMGGSYPAVATVTAARSTGSSTLSCDDLSTWATDTPVHFSTFKVSPDGSIDTSTQTDWKGIVNGNTITDMTRLAGAADSGNASGDRVELNPTVGWLDDLITGILVSHKQNGALKDSVVTENSIATGAVTSTKLGDGSVTSAKIATGAIDSYDKIGDDVIQARNLDFNTCAMHIYYAKIGTEISFTAEEDMFIEVEALTGYTWGYAAGARSLDVTTETGLTRLFHRAGGITGGDGAGRQLILHALYSTTKNTVCKIKVTLGGQNGGSQNGDNMCIVKCYKIASMN